MLPALNCVMFDLPAGLLVVGLLIEIVLVGSVLVWYRSRRKR